MAVNAVNFGNPLSINFMTKPVINRDDTGRITSSFSVLSDSDGSADQKFSYSEVAGKSFDTLDQQGYFKGLGMGTRYIIDSKLKQAYQDKPLIILDALGMLKPPTAEEAQTQDATYVKQSNDAWAAKWAPNNRTTPPGLDPAVYERWMAQHGGAAENTAGSNVSTNTLSTTNTPSSDNPSASQSATEGQSVNLNSDTKIQTKLATLAYKNADPYTSQALNTIMDMV